MKNHTQNAERRDAEQEILQVEETRGRGGISKDELDGIERCGLISLARPLPGHSAG